MSKISTSLLSTAGLLLVTTLALFPAKLFAENKPAASPALSPQKLTAPLPAKSVPSAPIVVGASASTPANVVPAIVKPSIGANLATPRKPVTPNSIPTAGQNAPVKPAVTAATSQPPVADLITLTLKLKEKKVYVHKDGKVIANYPVAVGKKGWETPTGEWQVMEKITNPAWTNFKNGKVVAPGAKNPLGERWIGFWTDGKDVIGFHGTPDVKSIGKAVSHGCVRMFDRDVKALFPLVKVGTTVKVVNE